MEIPEIPPATRSNSIKNSDVPSDTNRVPAITRRKFFIFVAISCFVNFFFIKVLVFIPQ